MKIEIKSTGQVSKKFLAFVQMVSEKENICDWTLIVWNLEGEAECIPDMKLIYMAVKPDDELMKAWFLHEVAHATFFISGGLTQDSIGHRKLWKAEFERILSYYMPDIGQKTVLWLKKIEGE